MRAGQHTHQAVLPQRPALESVPADTPWGRDETGHGRGHTTAPGTQHGRGETHNSGRHPDISVSGASAREGHSYVFVLDKHGTPLDPCHPAKARKLLNKGRARVHRFSPFVIRLVDRDAGESHTTGVEVGVDPGSRTTGVAVFTTTSGGTRRGVYSIELTHRGSQIKDRMNRRAAFRRRRRSKNLRYRAPRFSNRRRPDGWLAPSLQHRVDTTTSWVNRLSRWAPIRAVHMERVAFDTHSLAAGRQLEGVEYQHGTLAGVELREYLLAKWGRRCAYCRTSDVPLNVDHIHPRSRGGSDRVSNLALACVSCNQRKGSQPVEAFLAGKPARLRQVRAQSQAPLRDAAAAQSTRWALWRALNASFDVRVASGGRTKWNRRRNGLPKSHTLDALCVGRFGSVTRHPGRVLSVGASGRGSYARTRSDRWGFPRLFLPRGVRVRGFFTGDLVRAVVPTGRKAGTHTGRVAVRSRGTFNIRTRQGLVTDVHHRHVWLLQRGDGYTHVWKREEEGASSPT